MASENFVSSVFESLVCQPEVNIIFSEESGTKLSTFEADTSKSIKKRQILSLETKLEVIKDCQSGLSHREVAAKYKCGKTQIGNIVKQKEEILKEWETSTDRTRKRKRSETYEEVNKFVWEWYLEALKKELPVNGPILQAKAKEYASLLEIPSFAASNGWLNSFRKRHGIHFHKGGNKENNDNSRKVNEWKSQIASTLKEYSPKDIYTLHETKLLFRNIPCESLNAIEFCHQDFKNEHLSITFCCNAIGEKEGLLIVSNHFMPSYLKEIDTVKLGIKWHYNNKAWVTENIFKQYLQEMNEKMKSDCRKIVLFTGDIACHLSTIELSHIFVKLLPSYSVVISQPFDLGIINSFKLLYRKHLLKTVVAKTNENTSLRNAMCDIKITQAIKWAVKSWNEVKPEVIIKCFKMTGIIGEGKPISSATSVPDDEFIQLCELAGISNICNDIQGFNALLNELEANLPSNGFEYSSVNDAPDLKSKYDEQKPSCNIEPEEGLKSLSQLRKLFYENSCIMNEPKLFDAIDFIETKLEDAIIRKKIISTVSQNS